MFPSGGGIIKIPMEGFPLDEFQKRAAETPGPAMVIAGPGAGKTRLLLARVLHLLQKGVPPERIFLLTFTVKTCRELRERLSALGISGPRVETFHSLAYDLLYEAADAPPRLLSEEEATDLIQRLARKLKISGSPRKLLEAVRSGHPAYSSLRKAYLDYLSASDLYDYLRLLLAVPEKRPPFPPGYQVLIDECQDLSPEIFRFLSLFPAEGLFLVGDPAQAIYGFRGADPRALKTFLEGLPGLSIHTLALSYRVPERILATAESLREDLFSGSTSLKAVRAGGEIRGWFFPSEKAEAIGVAKLVAELTGGVYLERAGEGLSPDEVLVLARLRAVLSPVKETLLREGLPVAEPEVEAEERRQKLLQLADRLAAGTLTPEEVLSEIRPLAPSLSDLFSGEERERLAARLRFLSTADLISVSREGVNLLTIHGAKGLEAEAVILVGAEEGLLPLELFPDTDPAEEKRLLYVALTRAKGRFFFTASGRRTLFGKRLPGRICPWLRHLPLTTDKGSRPRRAVQQGLFALLLLFLLVLPAGAESLRDFLRLQTPLLLRNHPVLSALRARIRAQENRIAPAGALPDPRVTFMVRNAGDPVPANTLGEEPMSMAGIKIEQTVPWKGKRKTRERIAALKAKELRLKWEEKSWELWRDLVQSALEMVYLEREAEILREMDGILRELEESARSRYQTGAGIQADILRAAVERGLLRERVARNLERQKVLRERLSRRLLFTRVSRLPKLELPAGLPPLPEEERLSAFLEQAPRVILYRLYLRERELRAHLAELEKRPDPKFFAGWYSRGTYPEIYEFGAGISIPLFISRKQDLLARAEKDEALAAGENLEDVKADLRYRLQGFLYQARTEAELVRLYEKEILPQDQADLDSARTYYLTGKLDFLNVLERARRLLEHRLSLCRHRVNYLAALAGIQALLGRTLVPELPGPQGGIP